MAKAHAMVDAQTPVEGHGVEKGVDDHVVEVLVTIGYASLMVDGHPVADSLFNSGGACGGGVSDKGR